MKHFFILYFTFLLASNLVAGDNPCAATLLNINDPIFSVFDNTATTNSVVPAPPFGGYQGPDTWLSFTMPVNGFYLLLNEITMLNPAIAVYSGTCDEPKLLYNVLDNNCNGDPSPLIFIDKLNPGEQYYIRIWAQDGFDNGAFEIRLVETLSVIPDFIAFADASIVGDCIDLTQNQGGQQGCAWYQNAIDFNFPFVHEMTANFGTKNATGADGICLVYQSNGQNFCGGTGEGIGAGGMPNSAIFEFDTWRNTNLNDLFQDHCAFNVNGNMNHNASIEGPVSIGNIEDGQDHAIIFEWNPTGNLYNVLFDGAVVLSGSYDIINNCFGGSNMAFWGYTSSTGGSSNLHTICPKINIYEPSGIEYNEVDICDGESYMGYSEPGFYVDLVPGQDGCQYQINTLITVHAIPEPAFISDIVCEGEFVLVADNVYTLSNTYEINTFTEYGCDSVIFLELTNINLDVNIVSLQPLTCKDTLVEIFGYLNSNFPISEVNYTWNNNGNIYNEDTLFVSESGLYQLSVEITAEDKQCVSDTFITVEIDTVSPQIQVLEDVYIDCSNIGSDTSFIVAGLEAGNISTWVFNDSIVSNQAEVSIINEGVYALIVTDSINGCKSIDSLEVIISNDVPIIQLSADVYNCESESFNLNFSTTGSIDTFLWMYENQFLSFDSLPNIVETGNYTVHVINDLGCEAFATIDLEVDTLHPTIELESLVVPCDSFTASLSVDSDFDLLWSGPNNITESTPGITISTEGWYYVTVTNSQNFCENTDSSYVLFLGESPVLSLMSDTITCINPEASVNITSNQSNLSYGWTSQSGYNSEDENIAVNQEGWYIVSASNENGCSSVDSILVSSNLTLPLVEIEFDTIDCLTTSASLNTQIFDGGSTSWSGPNMFTSSSDSIVTSFPGVYFISVINDESGCEIKDTVTVVDISVDPEFFVWSDTLDCTTDSLTLPFSILTLYNSILWTGPNGFLSDMESPEVIYQGEYQVHLEFDGNCSLDTSLIIMEDIEPPTYTVEYDSITCLDPYVTFQFDLESGIDDFLLIAPSGNTASQLDFTSDEGGEYYFLLIGGNGCETKDTFIVSEYLTEPQVMVEDVDTITCFNPNINIEASSSESNLVYYWMGENEYSSSGSAISVAEQGEYLLTVTNQYGCTNTVDVSVSAFIDLPLVILEGEDIFCDNLEASLVFTSDDDISQVVWQGEGSFIEYSDSILVSSSGWYSVEVINEFGCSSTDSFFVESNTDQPSIDLLTGDTMVLNIDDPYGQVEIDVEYYSSMSWSPEIGLSCFDCLDPVIESAEISEYTVTVFNEFGCQVSEVVHVRYQEDLKIYIPNIFSPSNGDGINDFFTLFGNENIAIINSMKIFDRWGSLVGEKENFEPNNPAVGWDGIVSGQLGTPGVYAFIFLITDTEGKVYSYYGDLTLL